MHRTFHLVDTAGLEPAPSSFVAKCSSIGTACPRLLCKKGDIHRPNYKRSSVFVLSSDLPLNVAVGIFARNPIAKREASSQSYSRLLHVRCRPFHPCFLVWTHSHDSSLFPSLTLRWVVVIHYVTLCSSDFPLYALCMRSSDSPSDLCMSLNFRIGSP